MARLMANIDLQPVRGTRDFYPDDMRVRQWLFGHWRAVAAQFGFEEYDACVLESQELYVRKAGDEITGQLYNFEDKGGRAVALRPEMTPSLARMVLARIGSMSLPLRWFSIPQCFRYERMQRGRKREHFQWNMDIVGLDTVAAEVELMSAQVAFMRAVGLQVGGAGSEVSIRVSDRRVLEGFLADQGITGEAFAAVCVVVDKRDKIGRESTAEQLAELGISETTATSLLDLLEQDGLDAVAKIAGEDNPGVVSLRELLGLAESAGIGELITIDPGVVRGLSYYTGTVWELFAAVGELKRALAGGGRYDRLIETFGGKPTAMCGFGFGDVTMVELLSELERLPELDRGIEVVVYPMEAGAFGAATRLASELRAAGKRVAVDYTTRRFKHVIQRAEADGADLLVIIGEQELAEGRCKLRKLGEGREESSVALAAAAATISASN